MGTENEMVERKVDSDFKKYRGVTEVKGKVMEPSTPSHKKKKVKTIKGIER